MADRLKTISLRQFRERAVDINEPVDIAIRDRDGNLQILGYYTPYATVGPDATSLEPLSPGSGGTVLPLDLEDGVKSTAGRVIRTPQEAAAAVRPIHPVPKPSRKG